MRTVILEFPDKQYHPSARSYSYQNEYRTTSHVYKINIILKELGDSVSLNSVQKDSYLVLNIHDEELFVKKFFHFLLKLFHATLIAEDNELVHYSYGTIIQTDPSSEVMYKSYVYTRYELNEEIRTFLQLLTLINPSKHNEFRRVGDSMQGTRIKILKRRAIVDELGK